jgi:hypothetical protein
MSFLCNFIQPPVTLPFLRPHIIVITLFSNIITICSSHLVNDSCHMHQATGKIRVVYIIVALLILVYELLIFF